MQIYRVTTASGARHYTPDDPGQPAAPIGGESREVRAADTLEVGGRAPALADVASSIENGDHHELRLNMALVETVEEFEVPA